MPLPVGLLRVVVAHKELHDFPGEFAATGGETHVKFLLKRRLRKCLRHVKVENKHTFLVPNCGYPFYGRGKLCLMII